MPSHTKLPGPEQPEESTAVSLPRCYPHCCGKPWFGGNPEALGWAVDTSVSLLSVVGAGAFLGTALLKLAKDSVGCATDVPEGENKVPDCNERVGGVLKPSSLLSTVITIVGMVLALTMPVIGAWVDYSSHRLTTGRVLVTLYCTILLVSIFVSEHTWLAIALLLIPFAFLVWFETTLLYSYLPELSKDEKVLNVYTRSFSVCAFVALILYMVTVIGVSGATGQLGDDEYDDHDSLNNSIATARLAQSISFSCCLLGFGIVWFGLFRPRQCAHELEEGRSIFMAGFRQVGRTSCVIVKYYPRLKLFYIAIALCDPAMIALNILALTFIEDQLDFSAAETGVAMMVMTVLAIPGSFISSQITTCHNAVVSSLGALVLMIANTTAVAIFLTGPGQQALAYILSGIWGLGTGWKFTADRMVLVSMLPPEQDREDGERADLPQEGQHQHAELMGIYVFARQILAWLPPLLFTILNESGVSLRLGIGSLNIFYILALIAYISLFQKNK